MQLIKIVQRTCWLLGACLVGLACSSKKPTMQEPIKLVLFQADWCTPCKLLHKELEAAGITKQWDVHVNACTYHLPIVAVDLTNDETKRHAPPERALKQSFLIPESLLVQGTRVIASDNYSDKASLEWWFQQTLSSLPCPK